ncbi:MAG: Sapep family Mn(2+)-dependent dipeptidase [Eubacteriales bacterium]|nr:Sapep family Mn(2+)-dependent dipeptidase [Eubacteriales bacterium]
MWRKKLKNYIESHREEMIEDLRTLVAIESMRGEAQPGKPYGEGPAKALEAAGKMMASYGFSVTNYDNRVVTGDFNENEKGLDILAHLDVVPVTPENWTKTKPFELKVIDGNIYGRGTIDDKGPAIAALYAMRAIKECGLTLTKNVRLILGSDEECGSSDLEYYYSKEQEAPVSFTPDADFPLINLEKGRLAKSLRAEFTEKPDKKDILELHGGDKVNVVPAGAWAVVTGIEKAALEEAFARDKSGVEFTTKSCEKGIRIDAKGLASHACMPQQGKNAVCALAGLLAELFRTNNLQSEKSERVSVIEKLAELFPYGDTEGKAFGIAMEDEISGSLTMNLGIADMDEQGILMTFDSRIPVCGNDENVTAVIGEKAVKAGFKMEEGAMTPPHYVPADTPFVKTLLDAYERYSGKKGEALSTGGGTYVHELKNGVAFGCMMEGADNNMHGDDEFISEDMLLMSAKIFADAIYELCR